MIFIRSGQLFLLMMFGVSLASLTAGVVQGNSQAQTVQLGCTPSSTDARFAVIGDFGNSSAAEKDVADLVKGWGPDFVVALGDNNYEKGRASTIDHNIGNYYSRFIGAYSGKYGPGAEINRFFPVLGNHDWKSIKCTGSDCRGPYLDYFSLPGNERYYRFTWGPVEFFALDSDPHEPHGRTENSRQAKWLQTELAASTATWKIVYMHHPPYSSGSVHGSDLEMRWPFKAWGADAVFSGHEHIYERLLIDNLPYFVNGLGGKKKYGLDKPIKGSQVRYNRQYGAMLVTADAQTLNFQFINVKGGLVDEYTLTVPEPETTEGSSFPYTDFIYLPSITYQPENICPAVEIRRR